MSLVVSVQGKYHDLPLPEKLGPTKSQPINSKNLKVDEHEGHDTFSIPEKRVNRFAHQLEQYKGQEKSYRRDNFRIPRIRDVMSKPVKTLSPEDKVQTAWQTMVSENIRHIPLLEDSRIVGLVTQTDILPYLSSSAVLLEKIGVKDILLSRASVDLRVASSVMVERRIGCLPIIDEHSNLCGIITYVDILEYFVELDPFQTWA